MRLTLFDRWALDVDEDTKNDWFLEYVVRSPTGAGTHLLAGRRCLEAVERLYPHIETVYEAFGGIGGGALAVEDLWGPMVHIVNEFNPYAVQHLKANLPEVIVTEQDAYRVTPEAFDLVILDFGDLTVWKTREGDPRRTLLDRTFGEEPEAVLVTDIASRYLHLHRERYETILGPNSCRSYESYINTFADYLGRLYGYRLLVGYRHSWSTVMAFVKGDGERGEVHEQEPMEGIVRVEP